MNLEKDAIEYTQGCNIGAQVLKDTQRAVALPEGFKIHSLEAYFDAPSRFRGTLRTDSLQDFIQYANDNKSDDSALFIDKSGMTAKLIIDLGNSNKPQHGDHQALLALEMTQAGKAIENANDERFEQQKLCEWLEDWRDYISIEDDAGESMTLSQATAAIRRIETSASVKSEFEDNESHKKLSRSEQIEAKMKGKQPAIIRFNCEPYAELGSIEFVIKLSVIAAQKPVIRLRVIGYEVIKEALAQTFKEKLNSNINDVPSYVGQFLK
ncbi:DUF2303 family protein [Suttonella ornithocola]|uniref:Uncharacterized conserved protein n=1 Tax=Suttonella ornithocola TaxID=279832 RepID=A0A380RAF9_9GAMM|nr:DUF2303 family protein [Suttonella ornithocola]SUO95197.1 Uncharacterized conserved protein [Suttonella ornithocola]SUQ09760.1 Uncharacterized conserved protein [Suttonella ornithocola]